MKNKLKQRFWVKDAIRFGPFKAISKEVNFRKNDIRTRATSIIDPIVSIVWMDLYNVN